MQTIFHEKFVIDENGKRTAVLIDAKERKSIGKGNRSQFIHYPS